MSWERAHPYSINPMSVHPKSQWVDRWAVPSRCSPVFAVRRWCPGVPPNQFARIQCLEALADWWLLRFVFLFHRLKSLSAGVIEPNTKEPETPWDPNAWCRPVAHIQSVHGTPQIVHISQRLRWPPVLEKVVAHRQAMQVKLIFLRHLDPWSQQTLLVSRPLICHWSDVFLERQLLRHVLQRPHHHDDRFQKSRLHPQTAPIGSSPDLWLHQHQHWQPP